MEDDNNCHTKATVAVDQVRNGAVNLLLLHMQEFNPDTMRTVPTKLLEVFTLATVLDKDPTKSVSEGIKRNTVNTRFAM